MTIVDYKEKYDRPITLCLGRFESLHVGHVRLIERAKELSTTDASEVMLMTYDEGAPVGIPAFGPLLLNFSERLERLATLGVKSVLRVVFDASFMATEPEDFLNTLVGTLNVKRIVCGFDFRFGKGRKGGIALLHAFCASRSIGFEVVGKVELSGEKISSSSVKKALFNGKIENANAMLGYNYFIRGEVISGRREGRTLGFPTANVKWPQDRLPIKKAVYSAHSEIEGKRFYGIVNFGAAPTFGVEDVIAEIHYKNFSGDLYGKTVTIEFDKYLREIRKFSSVEELKRQLAEDLDKI